MHRDDIKAELIAIFQVPTHIPIALHDKRFTYIYGNTGSMYKVNTTRLCILTDKECMDDLKDLLNENFIERMEARIFTPKTCTILPCIPTFEVPREIQELMIVSHNKTIASMKQGVICGTDWKTAKIERNINPHGVFGKHQPDITTISTVQLLAHSISCDDACNPIRCISRTARGELIVNYEEKNKQSVMKIIKTFKKEGLQAVLLEEDYDEMFVNNEPFSVQSLWDFRGPGGVQQNEHSFIKTSRIPEIPSRQRNIHTTRKHYTTGTETIKRNTKNIVRASYQHISKCTTQVLTNDHKFQKERK
jgi:hypothetical protein